MFRELPEGERKSIEVSDETLNAILSDVLVDQRALEALKLGAIQANAALTAGATSSPEPPEDYKVLYEIMNRYDGRLAGVMGPEIIYRLKKQVTENEL